MASEPHLRPVPALEEAGDARPAGSRGSRLTLALSIALAIALALLAWNRTQLAQQVVDLTDEVVTLESEVAERDRVIRAHQGRLNDVRAAIEKLSDVLAEPLPEAD